MGERGIFSLLYQGNDLDIDYLDFSRAIDKRSHNIHVEEREKHGPENSTVYNLLNVPDQGMLIKERRHKRMVSPQKVTGLFLRPHPGQHFYQ